jgi:allantoicase
MDDAMSELHDTDIFEWSEQQVALLRRLAAGEQVNDQVDWVNVIEEVESAGSEHLYAVQSLLTQALTHMLKTEAWPTVRDAPNWRTEAIRFRGDAADRFSSSMRQKIDLARLYRRALHALPDTIDGLAPLPVPETCPVTLDELLSDSVQP